MKIREEINQYLNELLEPEAVVSEWVVKLVRRHVNELGMVELGDFPFYFDEDAAARPIDFFGKIYMSNGKPFVLLKWQKMVLWMAYGWKRKSNKWRRFQRIYIKVPRKNGKTEFMAGIGMYGQSCDTYETNRQVFWFATKKEQARIGFDRQREMVLNLSKRSPLVAGQIKPMQYRIVDRPGVGTGFTTYLGKDSSTEDGLSPFYGICDEWHAHPNNGMVHVIESGWVNRCSPMMWMITTAGPNVNGPCAKYEETCKLVLDGVIKNDSVLPVIYDLSKDDKWDDPTVWPKVNPSLGETLTMDALWAAYEKIQTEGEDAKINFMCKNLNKWIKNDKTWIEAELWMENRGSRTRSELMEAMRGRTCFGGLDLASVSDLCSFALVFPPENEEDEKWVVLQWSWIPEDSVEKRVKLARAPYLDFIAAGELLTTEGNVTDYKVIKAKILEISDMYSLHSVAYDRYNSYQIIPELVEEGVKMEAFSQAFPVMTGPTLALEHILNGRNLEHGGDSVLGWAMSNVVIVTKEDFKKPSKTKAKEKIDPVVAMVMAIGQAYENLAEIGKNDAVFISFADLKD